MSNVLYVQQQGQSEVRLHRFGEWVDGELDGRRFHFRLRPCRVGAEERLLLRFRDASVCQQVLLRVDTDKLLFKSAFTVAAQRFEPRRTAIESLGVREGDLLIGSDVWSVDLLVNDRYARPASVVLRWSQRGLEAVPCRDSRLGVLGEGEEAVTLTPGPLRVLPPGGLQPGQELASTFVADDVLYEVSTSGLEDDRAQTRLAAVGYILPARMSRITLGAAEDCTVRLYSNARRRPSSEEPTWNLWFEAIRCRAEPGTVLSALGLGTGNAAGSDDLNSLLDGYLNGAVPPLTRPEPVAPAPVPIEAAPIVSLRSPVEQAPEVEPAGSLEPTPSTTPSAPAPTLPEPAPAPATFAAASDGEPDALVNKSFVLNKCEEVFALTGDRPELEADVRRLRTLLAQGDYHQASLLAEALRKRAQETPRSTGALDHGRRFRVAGSDFWFLERSRLTKQEVPDPNDIPGMIRLVEPIEICRIRVRAGTENEAESLEVAPPGEAPFSRVQELRFGRQEPGPETAMPPRLIERRENDEFARVALPGGNYSVSSQACRLFLENGSLCVGPWRDSVFEGDAIVKNFQLVLEHPSDRSPVESGDVLVLGNLLIELAADGEGYACRLAGALLERSEDGFSLGFADAAGRLDLPLPRTPSTPVAPGPGPAPATLRFRPGARIVDGEFVEDDGAWRVGPIRIDCATGDSATVRLSFAGSPLLRFGRAEGGVLCYSQRKRVTRVKRSPLYPISDELFVGIGWQSERDGAGAELILEGARPCYFRIASRPARDGGAEQEIYCQASVENLLADGSRGGTVGKHLRAGVLSPDDRLLPGDELFCAPARFRVARIEDAEGMELELDLIQIALPAGENGWIAGLDATVPDSYRWILRVPQPFPRSAKVLLASAGHFQLEGDAERLEREPAGLAVQVEASFQLYDVARLEGRRLRVGGLGSSAEVVHHGLEAGRLVAWLEAQSEGCAIRPTTPEVRLWLERENAERETVPPEGATLSEGCRFGVGAAELKYELQGAN